MKILPISALVLALSAGVASATEDLAGFFGGQGCTIGAESRNAALATGFSEDGIETFIAEAKAAGQIQQQRDYMVLGEQTCTIRLPDIASAMTLADPEIQAIVIRRDDEDHADQRGCFLQDPASLFEATYPGPDGMEIYLGFLGHGLVTGALRFHTPSQLRTPYGFQVMTGDCAEGAVATAAPIDDRAFNAYMRTRMEVTPCGEPVDPLIRDLSLALQDADPGAPDQAPGINAWRWFEFDLIAMGAGWIEGANWRNKGDPRPPMCHYRVP